MLVLLRPTLTPSTTLTPELLSSFWKHDFECYFCRINAFSPRSSIHTYNSSSRDSGGLVRGDLRSCFQKLTANLSIENLLGWVEVLGARGAGESFLNPVPFDICDNSKVCSRISVFCTTTSDPSHSCPPFPTIVSHNRQSNCGSQVGPAIVAQLTDFIKVVPLSKFVKM